MREVTTEPKPESAKAGENSLSIGLKAGRRGGFGHLSNMSPKPYPEEHPNLSSRKTSVRRNLGQMVHVGRFLIFDCVHSNQGGQSGRGHRKARRVLTRRDATGDSAVGLKCATWIMRLRARDTYILNEGHVAVSVSCRVSSHMTLVKKVCVLNLRPHGSEHRK